MKTIRKLVEMIRQKMPLKSLRLRIFAIVLVVGLVPGLIVGMGIVQNYEDRAVEHRISTVQNQLKIVANHLISNDYMANYRSEEQVYRNSRAVVDAELEMLSNLYEGRVMIINSNFKVVKDTYGISQGKIMISEEVIKCFRGESLSNYDPEHGYIEMTTPIMDTTANSGEEVVSGVMLTSISNGSIVAMMEMLNRRVMIIETLLALAIVVLAIVLAVVMTRPFNRITQAIMDVNSGYSDESISVPDYAETVHIVDAFNQLLARMRALDQSRQEFVANVSHELKTPMTSIKVLADSLLVEQEVPAQLYREFMEDIVSEIDRENRIITDLLALVKMDKKVQDLNITSLNINDLVELILKRLRPIARKKDVEVVFESMRPVVAEVDEVKMTLIMTNLVENSIKYNKEHGWVKVELDADHQFFTFKVSDSGIGIPEDALAHICERFYRVDKSHSREIGGTGLGLAITKSAVLLHRGTLTINSVEGEGSSFVVKIPLIYIVS
ncbi:MAG: cell wall metabolism sensor histidine kinase WalK [Acetatifactor sp.]|nr:cell wall metabolism sensor histidine kinase WalK [Acetatifactor sp.]MDE7113438.1 cell wall metabolism sensor histidine kinase WalK [Acetatifactor sp.]